MGLDNFKAEKIEGPEADRAMALAVEGFRLQNEADRKPRKNKPGAGRPAEKPGEPRLNTVCVKLAGQTLVTIDSIVAKTGKDRSHVIRRLIEIALEDHTVRKEG